MDIKALAIKAGGKVTDFEVTFDVEEAHAFARLIAEECAKVCEDEDNGFSVEGEWCAQAIRDKFCNQGND